MLATLVTNSISVADRVLLSRQLFEDLPASNPSTALYETAPKASFRIEDQETLRQETSPFLFGKKSVRNRK